jgi:hypothetical protein
MSELALLQSRFAAGLLTAGDNPGSLFRGDPDRMARRFALYRGNLTASWDKALTNAYPVLRMLVGAEFLRALAREYGRATPLPEGDLNRFGHALPEFLEAFEPVARYPYLPDVARLEWALHSAHYAADVPALLPATLASVGLETLDQLKLELHPACTLLESPWDVVGIWEAYQPGGPPLPSDLGTTSRALVCRPRWRPELVPLTTGELAVLRAVVAGVALGGALEVAADTDPDFDPGQALPRWLWAGVFRTIPCPPTREEDSNGRVA